MKAWDNFIRKEGKKNHAIYTLTNKTTGEKISL